MPEPEVYQEPNGPSRSAVYTYDAYSSYGGGQSDLRKQATTTSATQAGHRLPDKTNNSPSSPSSPYKQNQPLPDPYAPQLLPPGASAPVLPTTHSGYDTSLYDAYQSPSNDYPQQSQDAQSQRSRHSSLNSSKLSRNPGSYQSPGSSNMAPSSKPYELMFTQADL